MNPSRAFRLAAFGFAFTPIVLTIAAIGGHAQAAAGDLDPTFGVGGLVTTDFGSGSDRISAIAVQGDGRVVAVGRANSVNFGLARYNVDGSLDTSFGGDGKVTTDFGGVSDSAGGVAIQPDGRIVVAGQVSTPQGYCCDAGVARYNTDGSLDTSFGGDGKVSTDFGCLDGAGPVAIQVDGKIVAAGSSTGFCGIGFVLVRYMPDGSLDVTFDGDGIVSTGFGGSPETERAVGLATQGDGKIIAVGKGGSGNDFVLARYDSDGSLDTSFGEDGKVITNFGSFEGAADVVLQADGKIVVAGNGTDFLLARYNVDGSLDTSFDEDGKVKTNFGGDDRAFAVDVQVDGKVVAGGTSDGDFALARYHTDGRLDTGFGEGGLLVTDVDSNDSLGDIALQTDGKIIAAGGAGPCSPTCLFALARYEAGPADSDGDGIVDDQDYCADTVIPEDVPTSHLQVNRWALVDDDGTFDTTSPPGGGGGPDFEFTVEDTRGCSCEQIIEAWALGWGHTKFGCSTGVILQWIATMWNYEMAHPEAQSNANTGGLEMLDDRVDESSASGTDGTSDSGAQRPPIRPHKRSRRNR